MMKLYQFEVNEYLIGGSMAIREKFDIIKLLISTIKYIITVPLKDFSSPSNSSVKVVIYVDKMSRIFYCQDEKIYTIQFPFSILEENGNLKIYYNGYELDNKVTTILAGIFSLSNEFDKSLESIAEVYYNAMREFKVEDEELYWQIFIYLLSFEPGYLRYDYDVKWQDPINHPLNHLDIYYSDKNTFKIGLCKKINNNDLIDLLNINTRCKFLR